MATRLLRPRAATISYKYPPAASRKSNKLAVQMKSAQLILKDEASPPLSLQRHVDASDDDEPALPALTEQNNLPIYDDPMSSELSELSDDGHPELEASEAEDPPPPPPHPPSPPAKKVRVAGKKKSSKRAKKVKVNGEDDGLGDELKRKTPKKAPKKPKSLKYPSGVTLYPELINPTPQECYNVAALLTAAHGPANQPDEVPEPDNEVSGCGEVPSVLDALIRTLLSANTTNLNSSRAFKGLIDRFGLVADDGGPVDTSEPSKVSEYEAGQQIIAKAKKIGVGSVDWDNIRLSSFEEVRDAIMPGGLANVKAKNIKAVLDGVYAASLDKIRADLEEKGVKVSEDEKLEGNVSLEHLKTCTDDEAMNTLMAFNGVGVKTASCVALFCLRRPKFPVDTHVWRISKFLGWVPTTASRDDTYYHLDARIPNNLKYALHNLLIRHGRMCAHCKAGPEKALPKLPPTPIIKRVKKNNPEVILDDENTEAEAKPKMRTKKVWIGTGMMKEVIVEVPITGVEGENGGEDRELESCVLEDLVKRIRKPRARPVKGEAGADADADVEIEAGDELEAADNHEVEALDKEAEAEDDHVNPEEGVKMEE